MSLSSGTSSTSSHHSIMSTSSLDLLSYQDMLENVLAWLLEAEDVIAKQEPVVDITNTSAVGPDPPGIIKVKQQFNEHEVSKKKTYVCMDRMTSFTRHVICNLSEFQTHL